MLTRILFYGRLESLVINTPKYDVLLVLGDLNAVFGVDRDLDSRRSWVSLAQWSRMITLSVFLLCAPQTVSLLQAPGSGDVTINVGRGIPTMVTR